MLESFIGTQKFAVKSSLEKHFKKYMTFNKDSFELLLWVLHNMVQDSIDFQRDRRAVRSFLCFCHSLELRRQALGAGLGLGGQGQFLGRNVLTYCLCRLQRRAKPPRSFRQTSRSRSRSKTSRRRSASFWLRCTKHASRRCSGLTSACPQAAELEISDVTPFLKSTLFKSNNFVFDRRNGRIIKNPEPSTL